LPSECEDTASAALVFLCIFDTFRVHPDIAVANLSRPIPTMRVDASANSLAWAYEENSMQPFWVPELPLAASN
jgi:hypothetical protein